MNVATEIDYRLEGLADYKPPSQVSKFQVNIRRLVLMQYSSLLSKIFEPQFWILLKQAANSIILKQCRNPSAAYSLLYMSCVAFITNLPTHNKNQSQTSPDDLIKSLLSSHHHFIKTQNNATYISTFMDPADMIELDQIVHFRNTKTSWTIIERLSKYPDGWYKPTSQSFKRAYVFRVEIAGSVDKVVPKNIPKYAILKIRARYVPSWM
jgi:hypothetical protein